MTAENQKKYDAKVKRINDAIALKEPDMIPCIPQASLFAVFDAGYTMAELVYDTTLEKALDANKKYLNRFDPDIGLDLGYNYFGEGPVLEKLASKTMLWAGMPGDLVDPKSMQQFIEFPTLLDDEYDLFFSDRTGWKLTKFLPRVSKLTEPLANIFIPSSSAGVAMLSSQFSTPEMRQMIETMWEIDAFYKEHRKKAQAFTKEIEEMGYPFFGASFTSVPFDEYSDFLRGTVLSLMDLYDRPEDVERYIDEEFPKRIAAIKNFNKDGSLTGKQVPIKLHKAMDGFMNSEQYEKYYWRHLREIIQAIVDVGMVPDIFAEGKYHTRLEFLKDVPKGKVLYHFEDVNMAEAKRILGDVACISGGFNTLLLDFGTKEQVIDESKRLIDICGPGGGYILHTAQNLCNCKRENVEAMFETYRTYGKYK